MDIRAAPLLGIFRLNTRLFLNCLVEVDDEAGQRRASDVTNSMTFIAVHAADARDYMLGVLEGETVSPFAAYGLDAVTSIDQAAALPALDEVRDAWHEISRRLLERMAALGPEAWEAQAPARFPIDDPTILGMAGFLAQHDSYHIGQLALLRKHQGFGAMSYGEPEDP